MAFAILRLEKIKTEDRLNESQSHNNREVAGDRVKNVDSSKTKNNVSFVTSSNFVEDVNKRTSEFKKIRKNAIKSIELLLTASPEYFRDDPEDWGVYDKKKLDRLNAAIVNFLEKEFGHENLISVECHVDEKTPHVHAIVVPVKNGQVSAHYWTDSRKSMSSLQDRYAKAVEHLGLDRGIEKSTASHMSLKKYGGALGAITFVDAPVQISTPPILLTQKARQAWAEEESKRIKSVQKPLLENMAVQASVSILNKKKSKEREQDAVNLQKQLKDVQKKLKKTEESLKNTELALKRAEADRVRDIDLGRIISKHFDNESVNFMKKNENGSDVYVTQTLLVLSVKGQKFYDQVALKGGGGAIDLVKHLRKCDFNDAVAWLSENFSKDEAIASTMILMKSQTERFLEKTESTKAKQPVPASLVPAAEEEGEEIDVSAMR